MSYSQVKRKRANTPGGGGGVGGGKARLQNTHKLFSEEEGADVLCARVFASGDLLLLKDDTLSLLPLRSNGSHVRAECMIKWRSRPNDDEPLSAGLSRLVDVRAIEHGGGTGSKREVCFAFTKVKIDAEVDVGAAEEVQKRTHMLLLMHVEPDGSSTNIFIKDLPAIDQHDSITFLSHVHQYKGYPSYIVGTALGDVYVCAKSDQEFSCFKLKETSGTTTQLHTHTHTHTHTIDHQNAAIKRHTKKENSQITLNNLSSSPHSTMHKQNEKVCWPRRSPFFTIP